MAFISICIPVYNVSAYIERCVRSIFEQTYKDWEAIFVDDCSPDDSVKILEHTLIEYPAAVKDRVRIIHHDSNRGLAVARNTGVNAAQGEFVMHLDSDDWLEPTALEILVRKQQETDADIVSGNAVAHYTDREEALCEPEYKDKEEMMREMIEMNINHVLWRRIIRRSLYADNGINAVEGINIGEDHYTLPRLIYYAKKCVRVDEVVYHYNCLNENSYMQTLTVEKQTNRFYSDLAAINVLLDFFDGKDDFCVGRLKEIKARYLYRFSTICFKREDEKNYNNCMRELFSMGKSYLNMVGVKRGIRRFLYCDYGRFRLYLSIRGLV